MIRLIDAMLLYILVRFTWRAAWRLSAPVGRWRTLSCDGFMYIAPRVSARYQLRELARGYLRARSRA